MNSRMNPGGMTPGGGSSSHDAGKGGGSAPAPSYNSGNMQQAGKPGTGTNQNVLDAVKKVMRILVNFSIY